jgi:hypothetical protein
MSQISGGITDFRVNFTLNGKATGSRFKLTLAIIILFQLQGCLDYFLGCSGILRLYFIS